MKKIFLPLLIMPLLVACGGSETKSRNEAAAELHGLWISDDFLQNVEKTKSPYAAREYKTRLFGLTLDSINLLNPDSAYMFGFTEHEGGYDSPLYFSKEEYMFVNDTVRLPEFANFKEPFTLGVDEKNRLQMYFPDTQKNDFYRKINGIDECLRAILFSGNYKGLENGQEVVFGDNGQLTGFGDLQYYQVLYDFVTGFAFDAVCLQPSANSRYEDWQFMHYVINADTLRLYKIEGDMEEYQFELGKLLHTLVRE